MTQDDKLQRIVGAALAGIAADDAKRGAAIRAEIDANGTFWAASEIDRLRRKVAALEAKLARK